MLFIGNKYVSKDQKNTYIFFKNKVKEFQSIKTASISSESYHYGGSRKRRKYIVTHTEKKDLENVDVIDESYFLEGDKIKKEIEDFEDGDIIIMNYKSFCEVDESAKETIKIQKKEICDKNRDKDRKVRNGYDTNMIVHDNDRRDPAIFCITSEDRKKIVFEVSKDDDQKTITNPQLLDLMKFKFILTILNVVTCFPFFIFFREENNVKEYTYVVKKVIYKKGYCNDNSDFIQHVNSEQNNQIEMQNII